MLGARKQSADVVAVSGGSGLVGVGCEAGGFGAGNFGCGLAGGAAGLATTGVPNYFDACLGG